MQATANCDHWRAHAAFGPAGPAQRHSEYNSIMFVGSHPKIRPPTANFQPVKCQKERLAVFHKQGRCNGVGACPHTKFISLQSQGSARLEIVMNGVKSCVASLRIGGGILGSMLVNRQYIPSFLRSPAFTSWPCVERTRSFVAQYVITAVALETAHCYDLRGQNRLQVQIESAFADGLFPFEIAQMLKNV